MHIFLSSCTKSSQESKKNEILEMFDYVERKTKQNEIK